MATVTPGAGYPINANQVYPGGQVPAPTTPYSGTFIPTLWSGKLAKKFYDTTLFGAIANTDWEGEIKEVGDEVRINTIPDVTVRDYQVGQQLVYEVPEGEVITLKVDRGSYFGVNVNDVMAVQSKPQLMNMFTDEASEKMKMNVDRRALYKTFFDASGAWKTSATGKDALWVHNCGATAGAESGKYDLGTDAAPIALTGANIVSYVTTMSTVLDEANVPAEGRYLVVSPEERQLLMMSELAKVYVSGDGKSMLRNGLIGEIDRFKIYVCNHLPRAAAGKAWDNTTASATGVKRHMIFAGTRHGISFASQINKVEHLRNPNDFGDLVRGLNIWGTAVTQGQALTAMVVAG
jgi:hypothetical protein